MPESQTLLIMTVVLSFYAKKLIEEAYCLKGSIWNDKQASIGGFRIQYQAQPIIGSHRVTQFSWVVNSTTYFKFKMTMMGGYRGMSGYWNEYDTYKKEKDQTIDSHIKIGLC